MPLGDLLRNLSNRHRRMGALVGSLVVQVADALGWHQKVGVSVRHGKQGSVAPGSIH